MKHAILITAYKDLFFIKKIIDYFDEDFVFFIHIDKKCLENHLFLTQCKNVYLYKKYKVEWGGSNHLLAINYLIIKAIKLQKFDFYHLITGSDYPIKSLANFKLYFEEHSDENFIEFFSIPHENWIPEKGIDRLKYYWIGNNIFDIRNKHSFIITYLLKIQRKTGVNRKFKYFNGNLFGGGTYWSLSKNAIDEIIPYISNKKFMRSFNYSHCAEELFFQTILMNNHSVKCINNSLRFMIWEDQASSPKTLDENDLSLILSSDAFFGRKFNPEYSTKLKKLIDSKIIQ